MKLSKKARRLICCMLAEILFAIAICNIDKILPSGMSRLITSALKLFLTGGMLGVYFYIQNTIRD